MTAISISLRYFASLRLCVVLFSPVLPASLDIASAQSQKTELRLTNLAHLNHLYEEITLAGKAVAIVHIYCEYPDYQWVGDADEGIACVDDAARAAVVYLRHYEVTGDSSSLRRSRRLLDFCRQMQAEEGLFYNFIHADYAINRDGRTSFKSLGWWTARAVWALGEGYRVYRAREPEYAAALQACMQKVFFHLDTLLVHYPEIDSSNGFLAPRWLLYNSAADATSELMLGLVNYAQASNDRRVIAYLEKFSTGLLAMQCHREIAEPRGMFLSWRNIWHGWGNSQSQALAPTAALLQNHKIREAVQREVNSFYPFWMKSGWRRELEFAKAPDWRLARADTFPQIAYAVRPMIAGALRLAEISGEDRYAELAGELATWFFGNNPAQAVMYDSRTGRGFDGILSKTKINRNAGAESTIEALLSLLEVEANAAARTRLYSGMK
ncbi:MAG: hypothetical protein ACREOO_22400 [bacterium]